MRPLRGRERLDFHFYKYLTSPKSFFTPRRGEMFVEKICPQVFDLGEVAYLRDV
jgi:hypothetical protein